MTGRRLVIGLVTMGIAVPLVILYFLEQVSASGWLAIAATSFIGWCLAELLSNILARPRLENRSPASAIREWDPGSSEPEAGSSHQQTS